MEIVNIKNNSSYLKEYIKLCSLEWGTKKSEQEMEKYIADKEQEILIEDKVISVLGLIEDNCLLGFISLFRYEDEKNKELTPWYATMYVKKEYRGKEYSKILNDEILKEAIKLGYKKVYLKTDLINFYEKFGAKYIRNIENGEKLYYIDL